MKSGIKHGVAGNSRSSAFGPTVPKWIETRWKTLHLGIANMVSMHTRNRPCLLFVSMTYSSKYGGFENSR